MCEKFGENKILMLLRKIETIYPDIDLHFTNSSQNFFHSVEEFFLLNDIKSEVRFHE